MKKYSVQKNTKNILSSMIIVFGLFTSQLAKAGTENGGSISRGHGNQQETITFGDHVGPIKWNGFVVCFLEAVENSGLSVCQEAEQLNRMVTKFKSDDDVDGSVSRGHGNQAQLDIYKGSLNDIEWLTLLEEIDSCGQNFGVNINH